MTPAPTSGGVNQIDFISSATEAVNKMDIAPTTSKAVNDKLSSATTRKGMALGTATIGNNEPVTAFTEKFKIALNDLDNTLKSFRRFVSVMETNQLASLAKTSHKPLLQKVLSQLLQTEPCNLLYQKLRDMPYNGRFTAERFFSAAFYGKRRDLEWTVYLYEDSMEIEAGSGTNVESLEELCSQAWNRIHNVTSLFHCAMLSCSKFRRQARKAGSILLGHIAEHTFENNPSAKAIPKPVVQTPFAQLDTVTKVQAQNPPAKLSTCPQPQRPSSKPASNQLAISSVRSHNQKPYARPGAIVQRVPSCTTPTKLSTQRPEPKVNSRPATTDQKLPAPTATAKPSTQPSSLKPHLRTLNITKASPLNPPSKLATCPPAAEDFFGLTIRAPGATQPSVSTRVGPLNASRPIATPRVVLHDNVITIWKVQRTHHSATTPPSTQATASAASLMKPPLYASRLAPQPSGSSTSTWQYKAVSSSTTSSTPQKPTANQKAAAFILASSPVPVPLQVRETCSSTPNVDQTPTTLSSNVSAASFTTFPSSHSVSLATPFNNIIPPYLVKPTFCVDISIDSYVKIWESFL
ncbi:hypothetical protein BC829DRAFT_416986 [Chytridium lagenaria]|nr:hypothetical protein BC829DRAFT_416986 [Chytridium lagenaria]